MKLQFTKQPGGILCPADDRTSEAMTKFKTGEQYEAEIKRTRHPAFHRKMFALFNFCYAHWKGGNEFQDEAAQFDVFRKHLTVLAGYYDELWNIKGEVRIEAKSLAYANMSPEDFESCYKAVASAARKHIFKDASDLTWNRLMEFL